MAEPRAATPPLEIPEDFAAALARSPSAKARFDGMPPSHKREYLRVIGEAKRPETRLRRIEKSVATLAAEAGPAPRSPAVRPDRP